MASLGTHLHDCVRDVSVRSSLVGNYVEHAPGIASDGTRVDTPLFTLERTFVLAPA